MLAFLTQACEDKVTNQSTVCTKPILAVCGVCDALQGAQEQATEVQALDHNTSPSSSSSFPAAGGKQSTGVLGVRPILDPNREPSSERPPHSGPHVAHQTAFCLTDSGCLRGRKLPHSYEKLGGINQKNSLCDTTVLGHTSTERQRCCCVGVGKVRCHCTHDSVTPAHPQCKEIPDTFYTPLKGHPDRTPS